MSCSFFSLGLSRIFFSDEGISFLAISVGFALVLVRNRLNGLIYNLSARVLHRRTVQTILTEESDPLAGRTPPRAFDYRKQRGLSCQRMQKLDRQLLVLEVLCIHD